MPPSRRRSDIDSTKQKEARQTRWPRQSTVLFAYSLQVSTKRSYDHGYLAACAAKRHILPCLAEHQPVRVMVITSPGVCIVRAIVLDGKLLVSEGSNVGRSQLSMHDSRHARVASVDVVRSGLEPISLQYRLEESSRILARACKRTNTATPRTRSAATATTGWWRKAASA